MCVQSENHVPAIAQSGRLHDTVVLSLYERARPIPTTVRPDRVRGLHRSELFALVRDAVTEQVSAWEERVQALLEDLRLAHARQRELEAQVEGKGAALAEAEAVARQALAAVTVRTQRLAGLEEALIRAEQSGDPQLLTSLRAQVRASIESARRARDVASQRENELARLSGALEEGRRQAKRTEMLNQRLHERLREREARVRTLQTALETARRSYGDLWEQTRLQSANAQEVEAARHELAERLAQVRDKEAQLSEREAQVFGQEAKAAAMACERETLNAALASAADGLEALRAQLKAARTVQRMSERLGILTMPGGNEDERRERPDYPLFAKLQAALRELRERHLAADDIEKQLAATRQATEERAAGAEWLRKEVFRLRRALGKTRRRAESLDRERWTSEEALEAKTAEASALERRVAQLEQERDRAFAQAETARFELGDMQVLQYELEQTCEDLHAQQYECETMRSALEEAEGRAADEATRRHRVTAEAMQALQAAEDEKVALTRRLSLERAKTNALETARYRMAKQVDRLQSALHRDRGTPAS